MQLLEPDGRRSSEAEASFRVPANGGCGIYAMAPNTSSWVARVNETAYRFVSRRRESFGRVVLWGPERYPARYDLASALLIRVIGLVYVAAFVSLVTQITGLIGIDGIAPAACFFAVVADKLSHGAEFNL